MTRSAKVTLETLSAEWVDYTGHPVVIISKESENQRDGTVRMALKADEWETMKEIVAQAGLAFNP